jgi:hypothetical protein
MTTRPYTSPFAPLFQPRLVDGPTNAPRAVFLDPLQEPVESPSQLHDRISQTLDLHGEAVFAINRYAICEGHRRLGKVTDPLALPEYGAPDVIRNTARPLHTVFAATFPSAWDTGQVRSYALSADSPTIQLGIQAHHWITNLGAPASNRLLWQLDAS